MLSFGRSTLTFRAVIVAAAAFSLAAAARGQPPAVGSIALSLSLLAVLPRTSALVSRRRRRLDQALLCAAGATLLPLCRDLAPEAASAIGVGLSAVAAFALQRVREAQPDRDSQHGLIALQAAALSASVAPLVFGSSALAVLFPTAAAAIGVALASRPLSSDGLVLSEAAPALTAAVASVAALLMPQPPLAAVAGALICTSLLLLHAVEIESRRRAEAAKASRKSARLRCLIENIEEAICAADLAGEMTFVNRRFLRLFGLSATFGGRFADLLHRGDVAAFERQLRDCLESGRTVNGMRYRARRSDGVEIPVECSVGLIEAGGIRIGLQATLRDISHERLIEDSQRALAQRLEFFLEAMPLGCIVWDLDFRVQEWNPSAETTFGWSQLEALGRRYDEFLSAASSDAVGDSWPELLAGRQVGRRACRNLSKSGAKLDCEWFQTALLDAAGEVVAVASMVQDVTARKGLEEQLRQAQKLEAVGALAGGIAHDFNNLLTIILGNVALARMRLGPDHASVAMLGDAQTAAEQAAELVRQLLSFSRRQPGDLQRTSLGQVLSETARLFRSGLGEGVSFEVEISDDLPAVRAHAGQIGQLLMNLLVNARDALGPDGRILLRASRVDLDESECRARAWAEPGEYVVISVSDDGHGIDERTKVRIFEPFFTTKEVGKGTGLGLAVAYGIVQHHGGGIEIESAPDEGTTFFVYLPALEVDRAAVNGNRPPSSHRRRVLLLETDPELRAVSREALRREGFLVLEAADDKQALEHLRRHCADLDLAVVDMTMPGRASWAVWVETRRLQTALPVILTGGQRWVVGSLPGETFLPKPYSARALLDMVVERLAAKEVSAG